MKFFNRTSLLYATACALAGLPVGLYVELTAVGDYRGFSAMAPVAAFISAFIFFSVFAKRVPLSTGKTIAVGLLSGTVSHYICWYLFFVVYNVCHWISGGCVSSLNEAPANLWFAIVGSLPLTFFSLLFFGWYTMIAAVALAFVCNARLKKQHSVA